MDNRYESVHGPVTVVLVGIGGYGALYVDELLQDCDAGLCQLVGVVDSNPSASEKYQLLVDRQIPVFSSLTEFYREWQADLCCIAAPIPFHTPFSVCALEHGSCVLCEKPLTSEWTDGIALEALAQKRNLFVMSGYQWSYNDAILTLKSDILAGIYGKPLRLRTKVLWPRRYQYYHRSSGWAGKRYTADGSTVMDSIANNAAAHYLHNMLFLLGDSMNTAALPVSIDAELLRVNPIENFDSCALRMHMANGAEALFLASHATQENEDPVFRYEFENGTVTYGQNDDHGICAVMNDGKTIQYGNPFADQMKKVRYAIRAVQNREDRKKLYCTVKTAMPHARCIEAIRNVPIVTVPSSLTEVQPGGADGNNTLYIIRHLHRALNLCYDRFCMLSELEDAECSLLTQTVLPQKDILIEQ